MEIKTNKYTHKVWTPQELNNLVLEGGEAVEAIDNVSIAKIPSKEKFTAWKGGGAGNGQGYWFEDKNYLEQFSALPGMQVEVRKCYKNATKGCGCVTEYSLGRVYQ